MSLNGSMPFLNSGFVCCKKKVLLYGIFPCQYKLLLYFKCLQGIFLYSMVLSDNNRVCSKNKIKGRCFIALDHNKQKLIILIIIQSSAKQMLRA